MSGVIRRLFSRRRPTGPSVDQTVFIGAQFDLRDGLLEARSERIAELEKRIEEQRIGYERKVAELQAALAVALLPTWMASNPAIRKQRLDDMPTSTVPTALIRKAMKGRRR